MSERKKIDEWVYKHSEKPRHYVEVKDPPVTDKEKKERPQEARQVQYNNWSKHFRRYSGSYLPKDDKKLLKQGWVDITSPQNTSGEPEFRRKSSGQLVRHDYNKKGDPDYESYGRHWHWFNRWGDSLKGIKNEEYPYYDKYGNPCKNNNKADSPHHIGEEGEEFIPWQKRKTSKKDSRQDKR